MSGRVGRTTGCGSKEGAVVRKVRWCIVFFFCQDMKTRPISRCSPATPRAMIVRKNRKTRSRTTEGDTVEWRERGAKKIVCLPGGEYGDLSPLHTPGYLTTKLC